MRILFVSSSYYPHINGVYYFVCRIGPLLQQNGHQVAVIAPSASMHETYHKIDDLDVYGMPSVSVIINPSVRIPIPIRLKRRLKKIITNFKPDIIHIQDHFPLSKAIIKVNRHFKIPVVGTNHFMPENFTFLVKNKRLKKRAESYLWKGFTKVFNQVKLVTTPSLTGARLIEPHLNVEVRAISSGISFENFNPIGNADAIRKKYSIPAKPILLYVGRLDPEKHIEEILKAVAIAAQTHDFCFVVVGKGTSKITLMKQAKQLGINDKVIFTGYVPDEDIPALYKASRCFIIASIAELLSLSTIQGMASGLPVIAVQAGALVELVSQGENGYLFHEGDIRAIAQYIINIVSDEVLFRNMSKRSLEIVQSHDIRKTLKDFENLYMEQAAPRFNLVENI